MVESHLQCVHLGLLMGDIDLNEQFLNSMLLAKVQPFAGSDLTTVFLEELTHGKRLIWEPWARCGMGFVSSPYTAFQATFIAEEKKRGDPGDPSIIFRWCDVILNLPGDPGYKPCDSWVYKVRRNTFTPHLSMANDMLMMSEPMSSSAASSGKSLQSSGSSRCT
jgi:hypothetical protein